MADYIKREDAYETIKHLLYETAMNNIECAPQFADACEDIAENRLKGYISAVPAADALGVDVGIRNDEVQNAKVITITDRD